MNIQYVRSGDYYIPALTPPEESRSIGKWGRMHRRYLEEHHPIQYANVVLSCKLWTYLADLNDEQYPCQGRGNRPGGADLCMNLEEYNFLTIT